MKKSYLAAIGAGVTALMVAGGLLAQSVLVPQVQQINSTDLFQDIVQGQPQAQSFYAPAPMLANLAFTQAGSLNDNSLIGGDFTTNLFDFGTSVTGITTTSTYVADGWFAWSGTSTTLAGNQETAAADILPDYGASLRITRSGAGVVQSCVGHVLESNNSVRYQNNVAELDFHALAGSGFSAANSNLAVYIATGLSATTPTQSSANFAFSLNGGGGGNAIWSGFTKVANGLLVPITTGYNRFTVVAPIGATETQIGVAICWTPVGASPSNDFFEFTGAQLVVNPSLATVAGTTGAVLNLNDPRAKSFARRSQQAETALQQRWVQNFTEQNLTNVIGASNGIATSSTNANITVTFTEPMRAVPSIGLSALGALTVGGGGAIAGKTAAVTIGVGGIAATTTSAQMSVSVASGLSASFPAFLMGNGGAGQLLFNASP